MSTDIMASTAREWNKLTPVQKRAAMWASIAAGGFLAKSKISVGIGLAGLLGSLVDMWATNQLTVQPEKMNAFFKSGGKISAVGTG